MSVWLRAHTLNRLTFAVSPEDKCSVARGNLKLELSHAGHITDEGC